MKKYSYILLTGILLLGISTNDIVAQKIKHPTKKREAKKENQTSRSKDSKSINGGARTTAKRPKTKKYDKPKSISRRPVVKPDTRYGNGSIKRKTTKAKIRINKKVRVTKRNHNRYYNGHRGYHPYRYHPYKPHRYGAHWHPFGFIVRTMVKTAIIVSINNQRYHYDNGVYYTQSSGGYTVVNPPTNIVVNTLPEGFENIILNGNTYSYFGGAFYVKENGKYKVIDAPYGAAVTYMPEGATEEEIDGVYYVVYNYTYYQPFSQNGKDMYQVVEMESID